MGRGKSSGRAGRPKKGRRSRPGWHASGGRVAGQPWGGGSLDPYLQDKEAYFDAMYSPGKQVALARGGWLARHLKGTRGGRLLGYTVVASGVIVLAVVILDRSMDRYLTASAADCRRHPDDTGGTRFQRP